MIANVTKLDAFDISINPSNVKKKEKSLFWKKGRIFNTTHVNSFKRNLKSTFVFFPNVFDSHNKVLVMKFKFSLLCLYDAKRRNSMQRMILLRENVWHQLQLCSSDEKPQILFSKRNPLLFFLNYRLISVPSYMICTC